ncbi:MAG: sulfatase-like hydrolase/transferase [Verrucomicrobiota bacterium]
MISPRQPNVLVVFTDQQRWDCAGLHGNPLDLMPNFDRLARAGTHLRHSFTCQPLCVPARAAFQTGRYPSQLGAFRNDCPLPVGTPTLAHHFAAGGYRTGYIGKFHLAPREFRRGVPEEWRAGYQDWFAANILELASDAYDCRLYDEAGREHRLPGYRVDALADAAIRYVAQPRTQPYFLFLSFLEPHHQNNRDDYPAPDVYAERYRGRWTPPDLAELGGSAPEHLAGYCGMVRRLDEALGRLYDALKSLGQLENTILLFTSDHGCHFKTRNDEYKRSPHESSIRVPTMLHGPGFMGGGDRSELVSLIDLPPTLLDAADIAIPAAMQGHSLLPRLRDPDASWSDEVLVEVSEAQSGRALRTRRWKYSVAVAPAEAAQAWHHAAWPAYTEQALYDLEADPYELINLIARSSHAAIAAELRQCLVARIVAAGDPRPVIEPADREPAVASAR